MDQQKVQAVPVALASEMQEQLNLNDRVLHRIKDSEIERVYETPKKEKEVIDNQCKSGDISSYSVTVKQESINQIRQKVPQKFSLSSSVQPKIQPSSSLKYILNEDDTQQKFDFLNVSPPGQCLTKRKNLTNEMKRFKAEKSVDRQIFQFEAGNFLRRSYGDEKPQKDQEIVKMEYFSGDKSIRTYKIGQDNDQYHEEYHMKSLNPSKKIKTQMCPQFKDQYQSNTRTTRHHIPSLKESEEDQLQTYEQIMNKLWHNISIFSEQQSVYLRQPQLFSQGSVDKGPQDDYRMESQLLTFPLNLKNTRQLHYNLDKMTLQPIYQCLGCKIIYYKASSLGGHLRSCVFREAHKTLYNRLRTERENKANQYSQSQDKSIKKLNVKLQNIQMQTVTAKVMTRNSQSINHENVRRFQQKRKNSLPQKTKPIFNYSTSTLKRKTSPLPSKKEIFFSDSNVSSSEKNQSKSPYLSPSHYSLSPKPVSSESKKPNFQSEGYSYN